MATNTVPGAGPEGKTSPTTLPLEFPYRTRLSWDLGTRVVESDQTERLSRWTDDRGWGLFVFRVAAETNVLRFQTPIGRELFYGVERAVEPTIRSRLEAAAGWRRIE